MTRDDVLEQAARHLEEVAFPWVPDPMVSRPWAERVRALKSQPTEKSPEVEELSRLTLVKFEATPGHADLKMRGHPEILGLMVDCLTGLLDGHDAPNYVSFALNHETRGQFEMIVQRVAGLRPAEVATKERARADAAEAERDALKAQLAVWQGDECEADGDGPCGACRKCCARMREENESLRLRLASQEQRAAEATARVEKLTAEVQHREWVGGIL